MGGRCPLCPEESSIQGVGREAERGRAQVAPVETGSLTPEKQGWAREGQSVAGEISRCRSVVWRFRGQPWNHIPSGLESNQGGYVQGKLKRWQ